MSRWPISALASSLRLAVALGLYPPANDNGQLAGTLALRSPGGRHRLRGSKQNERIDTQSVGEPLDDGKRGGCLPGEQLPEVAVRHPAPVGDVADRDAPFVCQLAEPCCKHLLQPTCHGGSVAVADPAVLLYPEEGATSSGRTS